MEIAIADRTHDQIIQVELARDLLKRARKTIISKIARACVSDKKQIISLIEQHIELFELQHSLHLADDDLIAGIISAWSE